MISEWPAPTRTCAATGRELKPGERYVGVVVDEAGKLLRKEFAPESWQPNAAGLIGFWHGRVPDAKAKPAKPSFNEPLLLDCLDHLRDATEPSQIRFRYVVVLLLMRRKRLKFEDTIRKADGTEALVVRDTRNGKKLEVLDPRLNEIELEAVQAEVFQLLGWEP